MRLLTIFAITFTVLIAAGSIYLHLDTKRFIESTQQAIKQDSISSETLPSPQNQLSDSTDAPSDTSSDASTQEENQTETYDWRDDVHADHTHEHHHDPWAAIFTGEDDTLSPSEETESEPLLTYLINKFGDIPEVHLFVDAFSKLESGRATVDDLIEYYEVKSYLYPSPEVNEAIKIFKRARAEGRPVSFKVHEVTSSYQPPPKEPDFSDVEPFFQGVSPVEGLRRLRQTSPKRAADVEAYLRSKALEHPEEAERVERTIKESYEPPTVPQ